MLKYKEVPMHLVMDNQEPTKPSRLKSLYERALHRVLWKISWGNAYVGVMKFGENLRKLQDQGLLGKVIVEVGAGKFPVTSFLDSTDSKIVEIDRASDEESIPGRLRVKLDINKIADQRAEVRSAAQKILGFIDPAKKVENGSLKEQVDTFVISRILNYVDFRKVLMDLKPFLKPGGKFLIYEEIGLADYTALLHKRGIAHVTKEEFLSFLKSLGLEITTIQDHGKDPKTIMAFASRPGKTATDEGAEDEAVAA